MTSYAQEEELVTSSRSFFFGLILLGHLGFFWSLNSGLTSSTAITLGNILDVELAELAPETVPRLPPPPVPTIIEIEPPSLDQPVVIVAEPDATAADAFAPDPFTSGPFTSDPFTSGPSTPTTEGREASRQISPPLSNPLQPLTPPSYPATSQRLAEEGRVVLDVYVLDNGRVADARVLKSSGYTRLDQAALEEVKRGWRLLPGTEDGKPTAMWVRLAVSFQLNKGR